MALAQGSQRPSSAAHSPQPPAAGVPHSQGGSPPLGAAAPARGPQGRRDDPLYETDLFRIHCFKVLPCGKRYAHDWMRCPFRHPGEKAARRPLNESSWYSANMCPDLHGGSTCPRGDACGFAHNVFEHWLHPDRYRTQLCRDGAACSRRVCFFAHSIQQLRTPTGRVIAAADTAEAEAAAAMVAAAGWAGVPGLGGNEAGAPGLMADGPLLGSTYPRPLADMILYAPLPGGTGAAPAPPSQVTGPPFGISATLISSPGHPGLPQSAAGRPGNASVATAAPLSRHTSAGSVSAAGWPAANAGLGEPSMADVFQALTLDASDKQAKADAAAVAASCAIAAADEAASLIGHLALVGQPEPAGGRGAGSGSGSSAALASLAPCLVDMGCYDTRGLASFARPGRPMEMAHLCDPFIDRRPLSASCSALVGPSLPATAPLATGGEGSPAVSAARLSGAGGAPLLRFLSGDQSLAALGAGAVPALTAPLVGSPALDSSQLQQGAVANPPLVLFGLP